MQRLPVLCQHLSRAFASCLSWVFFFGAILPVALLARDVSPTIGLPFAKPYALEDIGAFRGARICFDRMGRLAVIGERSFTVLNDNTWIDISTKGPASLIMSVVVNDGQDSYYGALASWGVAEYTRQGTLEARSLRPEQYPGWVLSTNFTQIVVLDSAIIFAGTNGLVYLDKATRRQEFVEFPDTCRVFTLGGKVFVSSHKRGTSELDLSDRTLRPIDKSSVVIDEIAPLGDNEVLASTTDHRLVIFDGKHLRDWSNPFGQQTPARVSRLLRLPDGLYAMAIDGKGLYILTRDGQCRAAVTTTEYQRIYDMACNESGLLWLSTETSILKLYYSRPVSIIDQRSGVVTGWPQLTEWRGRVVAASEGQVYDFVKSADGFSYSFEHLKEQPSSGGWAMAGTEDALLIGNNSGIVYRDESGFHKVINNVDISRLSFGSDGICLAIGKQVILAVREVDGQWKECAPRVPGLGFPSVIHKTPSSCWLELGLNRVGRVWYADGRIHTQVFDTFPWKEPTWVNIGSIGDTVIFSGPHGQRVFFDERSGSFVQRPDLDKMLSTAPFPILRVVEDKRGVLWTTHESGVCLAFPTGEGYLFDTTTLGCIRDRYPIVELTGERDAWIATASTLYHAYQDIRRADSEPVRPFIVSIFDGRTGEELYSAARSTPGIGILPYSKNHLLFRFFTGSYQAFDQPVYRFTIHDGSAPWSLTSRDSLLALPNLSEGRYEVTAELVRDGKPVSQPVTFAFVIRPPWFRSLPAYVAYAVLGTLVSLAFISFLVKRLHRRQIFLENLVHERTEELRSTMDKLTEEARMTATLAERNRLAGEIHDSIQQGLSGLILQLDATLKLPQLSEEVVSRLSIARRMVSYTRSEVQQAVWNMESPLLNNAELSEALRTMADLISAGKPVVEIHKQGDEPHLGSTIKHNLLRIAQEAITNAVRHSGADRIVVSLDFHAGQAVMEIADNGKGFDPAEVIADGIGHFGLRGLRARAAKINASLVIRSTVETGTRISCTLPLPSNLSPDANTRKDKDTPR
jgi:signal transduction histidine kinase